MSEETNKSMVSKKKRGQQSLLIRALWYIFVGWWATSIWLGVAWLLVVSLIGMPLGFWMINRVPKILTLKRTEETEIITESDEGTSIEIHGPNQRNIVFRSIYFILIGWWFSFIWIGLAGVISITVLGIPLAIWMYNRIPEVTTLYRHR